MDQEPVQPTPTPTPIPTPPRRTTDLDRTRMGWIALAIVACLALVVPIVVVVAASTAPLSTTVAGGPKGDSGQPKSEKPGKSGKADKGKADNGKGPMGNNGRAGKGPISISAIDGSNISLATKDGWVRTIAISDTTVIIKGGSTVPAADLKVGDVIRFHQVENADGTFTVDAIRVQIPKTTG